MAQRLGTLERLDTLVAAALRGELEEARARQLYARGAEAVTLTLLALTRRIAELQSPSLPGDAVSPSTPSGMIPVCAKIGRASCRERV